MPAAPYHWSIGVLLACLAILIGKWFALIPIGIMSAGSHLVDDWNFGTFEIGHIVENFKKEHRILTYILVISFCAFLIFFVVAVWLWISVYAAIILLICAALSSLADVDIALNYVPGYPHNFLHKLLFHRWLKTGQGSVVFYTLFAVCMASSLIMLLIYWR